MRAWLYPLAQSPHAAPFVVDMIARTGNGKIKVQGVNKGAQIFSVARFRLRYDASRQVTEAEFNALPWQGAGPDPAQTGTADFFAALEQQP